MSPILWTIGVAYVVVFVILVIVGALIRWRFAVTLDERQTGTRCMLTACLWPVLVVLNGPAVVRQFRDMRAH